MEHMKELIARAAELLRPHGIDVSILDEAAADDDPLYVVAAASQAEEDLERLNLGSDIRAAIRLALGVGKREYWW